MTVDRGQFVTGSDGTVTLVERSRRFDQRLTTFLRHVAETSDFYGERVAATGISLAEDPLGVFLALPATTKRDYRVALQDEALDQLDDRPFICDFSSGSTSECVMRLSTWIDELAELDITEAVFQRAGVRAGDRFVCLEVGMPEIYDFYCRAARQLGAVHTSFLPVSRDYAAAVPPLVGLAPTVILTIPSILARLWPYLREAWPRGESPVRSLIHMGEAIHPELRREVRETLGCEIFSFYGTTEVGGMAGACREAAGGHFDPCLVLPSVARPRQIDATTVEGEALLTTLHLRTQAVVKYEVGDRIRLTTASCACGEQSPRLRFLRRTHDSFTIVGTKFHHDMILETLREVVPYLRYLSITLDDVDDFGGATRMTLALPGEAAAHEEDLRRVLTEDIFELDTAFHFGFLTAEFVFLDAAEFGPRKIRRVVDRRQLVDPEETPDPEETA